MKTKKLKLNALRLESFVTQLEERSEFTVKGGGRPSNHSMQCGSGGALASTKPACYDK